MPRKYMFSGIGFSFQKQCIFCYIFTLHSSWYILQQLISYLQFRYKLSTVVEKISQSKIASEFVSIGPEVVCSDNSSWPC